MALQTMIEELVRARRAFDEKLEAAGESAGREIASALARDLPLGYSLRWTQYTPHFNDGDACTFGVNEAYVVRDVVAPDDEPGIGRPSEWEESGIYLSGAPDKYGVEDRTVYYDGTEYDHATRTYKKVSKSYVDHGIPAIQGYSKERLEALVETWKSLPEYLMERAFGDHARVVVRSDGTFEVDEYSHD